MQDVLQWIAIIVGPLWLASVARRSGQSLGVSGAAASGLYELARANDELKHEIAISKKAVGYDEVRTRLDRDVVWDEAIRRQALGSLLPRVGSLEWKLCDLHLLVSDALKANALKDELSGVVGARQERPLDRADDVALSASTSSRFSLSVGISAAA